MEVFAGDFTDGMIEILNRDLRTVTWPIHS
jgi:hypothetical protein